MSHKLLSGFLHTPPLWRKRQFGISQFAFPEVDLKAITAAPIPNNLRLGHQMEHVFTQLIPQNETYEIVVHNLPVKKEGRTLGEIDFILRDTRSQKLVHVELTYKFYIIEPEISEPIHRLMGPNKRDMFFTKMEKIKNRQFALLHSPEGIKALGDVGLDHATIEHEACFKAQLFLPYEISEIDISPLNKACISGRWIRFDDFNTKAFAKNTYYVPRKSQWVIPPCPKMAWRSHHSTLLDLNLRMLKENAPMVWMRRPDGVLEKLFVVWW